MNHVLPALLALVPSLAAQGPSFQVLTGSDYSMVADVGAGEVIDGKPANTTLSFPFELAAKALPGASAKHKSELVNSSHFGKGLRIREFGFATRTTATGESLAGTLDEVEPTHLEPHALILGITGTTKPKGVVTVVWQARATAGNSFATTAIDLDGDLTPEFEGAAGCGTIVKSFPVTATSSGYFFKIETSAGTEVEGIGTGSFSLELSVYFREGSAGATFTPFGPECAGKLTGSTRTNQASEQLELSVRNAAANALGALVIGRQEATLELGTCDLLVAPLLLVPVRTSGSGAFDTSFTVRDASPYSIRTQVLTLSISNSALRIGSTNGLEIEG